MSTDINGGFWTEHDWQLPGYPTIPFRGREYREKDFLTGNTGKPTSVSFSRSKTRGHSPARESPSYSFLDHPRQTPPRPARLDSPGRIGDLSSIQRDPYEGKCIVCFRIWHSFKTLFYFTDIYVCVWDTVFLLLKQGKSWAWNLLF